MLIIRIDHEDEQKLASVLNRLEPILEILERDAKVKWEAEFQDEEKQAFPAVQFFVFHTFEKHPHNGKLCEIIGRAGIDSTVSEPQFKIQFNNGLVDICLASELRPWYPAR